MAGVGDDTVLIGYGGITSDEISQLAPPEPVEKNELEDNHEDLPDDGREDERRTAVDEELDAASNDAEREKIRARRKQERIDKRKRLKDRSEAQERRVADLQATNKRLEERLLNIEKQNHSTTMAQLNVAVEQTDQALEQLRIAEVNATNAKDGPAMLEAKKRIEAIMVHKQTLIDAKSKVEKQVPAAPRESAPQEVIEQATAFRRKHPWFVDKNKDLDSQILSNIDNAMLKEGWDPRSPSYWTELETRGAKYLPDRFKKASEGGDGGGGAPDNQGQGSGSGATRRSTTVGGGSGGATRSVGGGRQAELSAGRVQALKDANKWDDPVLRAKGIKAYQDYDKEHATR